MYETGILGKATGGILHPGGLDLTMHLLNLCNPLPHASILDVGCGNGSSAACMRDAGFQVVGLDRSELLLHAGAELHPNLPLACSWSKSLPVVTGAMDVILAECSLSAMSDFEGVLAEFHRVLHPGGCLALSDVYVRNPEGIVALRGLPMNCGLRTTIPQDELTAHLQEHGFEIIFWEDHSDTLKYLAAQMIFSHGSLDAFWHNSEPGINPLDIQVAINRAKLGYYLLVAKKG
jgi:arsenite methyltransferase